MNDEVSRGLRCLLDMAANKHGDHDQHVREPTHRAGQHSQPPIASEPAWNKGKHASQVRAGSATSLPLLHR